MGVLEVGVGKLRLGLHVEAKPDGGLSAVLDSLDQGAKIPVASALFAGGQLRLELPAIGATFEGKLDAEGSALEGTWSQGAQALPLTFTRQSEAFALVRPQQPKAPFPYASREVTFESAAGGVRLAGTLLLPEGKGPFPAVIFLTGSGKQDRDETLMGHKPFLVIADALARRGIASLRWDDRGKGGSAGDSRAATIDDLAADARAALAFLRARPELRGSAIGIVGHSEGGLIAPIVAAGDRSVAFLVLLAPPGVPIRSLLLRQARDLYRLQGLDGALVDRVLAVQAEDFELIADPSLPTDRLVEALRARSGTRRKEFSDAERARLGVDSVVIERIIQDEATAWYRSLLRQVPAAHLRQVKAPILALFGDRDLQVAARENAEEVRAALAAAGNPDHEERILPGLNHLFQHAQAGGMEEYGTIEETFAPEALNAIGDWVLARFSKR
jgi:pimeloyl-ACP methyl ester carboxylesterase